MPQAKWLVQIDWSNDGDFSDGNEDVTSDVTRLTLEHFRDLASGRVEAAQLELQLRNDDHKYSPPNAGSPIGGDLKPGRKVWVRAAYPYDGFADSPGVRLADHVPDYDSAFRWKEHLGAFRVGPSGAAAETAGALVDGGCVAAVDFGDANASFGCGFTRGSDSARHGGLCFRVSDSSNYLYVRVTGTAVELRKVRGGADSRIASASHTWASAVRKALQVVLHGDSIRVFVDDDEVLDATSPFNRTATRHGLFCGGRADHSWDDFGGWVSLFYGYVDSIRPRPRAGAQYCYVRALDEMERLTGVTLYTYATAQMPQASDRILGDILDYSDVDAARRRLDGGQTLVPHTWSPSIWGVQAMPEIHRLQDEEDGLVYVDGHGFWRMESRGHRADAPHTASMATLMDTDDGSNAYFSDMVWDDGAVNVENVVFVRIRGATNRGARTAWTLTEKPRFSAHETKDFLAESKDYDVVAGQLTPAEGVDYRANTSRSGYGADISSELTVTHPNTIDYNGKGTLIRVRFGAAAGYLTLLELRTLYAFTYDAPLLVIAEDSASKDAYGERIRSIDARWTREVAVAQAAAESRRDRRKDPKTVLRVVVPNGSPANLMLALQRSLSDRVTVRYDDIGIDQDFFIEGRKIAVSEGWTLVTGELLLQGV